MLEHLLQITPLCFMIAVISVVYMRILKYEPAVSWWFRLGVSYGIKQVHPDFPTVSYTWWYKPLFECEKCLAGQMALWSYFVYMGEWHKGPVWFYFLGSFRHPIHLVYWEAPNYDFICHLYLICGSIALSLGLSTYYSRFKNMYL